MYKQTLPHIALYLTLYYASLTYITLPYMSLRTTLRAVSDITPDTRSGITFGMRLNLTGDKQSDIFFGHYMSHLI